MWETARPLIDRLRKHRVGALAAEVAFFGLLSIPSLLIGFIATAGLIARLMGPEAVSNASDAVLDLSGRVFSADVTTRLVRPSIQSVLETTKFSALSVGYILAIWSGSRMINALYQGVEILTEQDAHRSGFQTRLRAIKTLFLGFFAVSVGLPLVLAGPRVAAHFLRWYLSIVSWVVVAVAGAIGVAWLFRQAIPSTPSWRHSLKFAVAVLLIWTLSSAVLQWWLTRSTSSSSLYGPLSAPIALLIWMEVMALIFLIAATVLGVDKK